MRLHFSRLGYAPATLLPRAVSLLFVMAFTRVLSPGEFGLYALALLYGELLDSVFLGWGRLGMLRFRDPAVPNGKHVRASLVLQSVGLIAGCVAAFAWCSLIVPEGDSRFIALLLAYFVSTGMLRFGLSLLRSSGRQRAYVITETLRAPIGFLLAWLFVRAGGESYQALVAGITIGTAAAGLAVVWLVRADLAAGVGMSPLVEMSRYALPLVLVFLATQAIVVVDRTMLAALSGPTAVGVYAAAYSLSRPCVDTIFNIINLDAFPRLVSAYEAEGGEAASSLLAQVSEQALFFTAPVLVTLLVLAEPISRLLLPTEYQTDAPMVIRLVALAGVAASFKSFVFDQVFHLTKNSLAQTVSLVPGTILGVLVAFYAIPKWGAAGAAAASFAGYGTAALSSFLWARRHVSLRLDARVASSIGTGCGILLLFLLSINSLASNDIYRVVAVIPGAVLFIGCNAFLNHWRATSQPPESALP